MPLNFILGAGSARDWIIDLALVCQADGTCYDDGTADTSGDTIQQAAVRASGIDPATGQWIAPQYQNQYPAGTDPAAVAAKAAADATAYYNQQLAKNTADVNAQNKACGGFLADLLNPFSANIDPNSYSCKIATSLQAINWTAVIALVVVLAVLATAHEVKEIL